MIKRIFDLVFVFGAASVLLLPACIVYLMVKVTSRGPAIYWSKRVGLNNILFEMPKFRSMKISTPALATHVLNQQGGPEQYLTPVGSFIRKTSLDEIPQLWSVLMGDMSVIGPRPALFNQYDLVEMRTEAGVHQLKPGITGWAQVNGRDEISIPQKVSLDTYYFERRSFLVDCKILFLTVLKVIKQDGITE